MIPAEMPARHQRCLGRGVERPDRRRRTGKLTLLCDELVAFLGFRPLQGRQRSQPGGRSCSRPTTADRSGSTASGAATSSSRTGLSWWPETSSRAARRHGREPDRRRPVPAVHLTIPRPAPLGVDDDKPSRRASAVDYRELPEALATLKPLSAAEGNPMPCYVDQDGHVPNRRRVFSSAGRAIAGRSYAADDPRDGAQMVRTARASVPDLPCRRSGGAASQWYRRDPTHAAWREQPSPWRRPSCAGSRCRIFHLRLRDAARGRFPCHARTLDRRPCAGARPGQYYGSQDRPGLSRAAWKIGADR